MKNYALYFMSLFLFTHCASTGDQKNSESQPGLRLSFQQQDISAQVVEASQMEKPVTFASGQLLKVKVTNVESEAEARDIVRNHRDFYLKLFVQSIDPYFGDKKLNEKCLAENTIQSVVEDKRTVAYFSSLTATDDLQIGRCRVPREPKLVDMLMVSCLNSKKVYEVSVYSDRTPQVEKLKSSMSAASGAWTWDCGS